MIIRRSSYSTRGKIKIKILIFLFFYFFSWLFNFIFQTQSTNFFLMTQLKSLLPLHMPCKKSFNFSGYLKSYSIVRNMEIFLSFSHLLEKLWRYDGWCEILEGDQHSTSHYKQELCSSHAIDVSFHLFGFFGFAYAWLRWEAFDINIDLYARILRKVLFLAFIMDWLIHLKRLNKIVNVWF